MLPPPLFCIGGGGGVDILARGSLLVGMLTLSVILSKKIIKLAYCCKSNPKGTLVLSQLVYASDTDRVYKTLGSLDPGF